MTRGIKKGTVIYKQLTMPVKATRAYYWIQHYISSNGESPDCYTIGVHALGASPDNYFTARNLARHYLNKYLIPQGFIVREGYGRGSKLRVSKPLTETSIIKE